MLHAQQPPLQQQPPPHNLPQPALQSVAAADAAGVAAARWLLPAAAPVPPSPAAWGPRPPLMPPPWRLAKQATVYAGPPVPDHPPARSWPAGGLAPRKAPDTGLQGDCAPPGALPLGSKGSAPGPVPARRAPLRLAAPKVVAPPARRAPVQVPPPGTRAPMTPAPERRQLRGPRAPMTPARSD